MWELIVHPYFSRIIEANTAYGLLRHSIKISFSNLNQLSTLFVRHVTKKNYVKNLHALLLFDYIHFVIDLFK